MITQVFKYSALQDGFLELHIEICTFQMSLRISTLLEFSNKESNVNINEPLLSRQRKRYENGLSEGEFPESVEDLWL